jgi:hypothetical protein
VRETKLDWKHEEYGSNAYLDYIDFFSENNQILVEKYSGAKNRKPPIPYLPQGEFMGTRLEIKQTLFNQRKNIGNVLFRFSVPRGQN